MSHRTILWGVASLLLATCLIVRADELATRPTTFPAPTQPSTQPSPKTHVVQKGTIRRVIDGEGTFQPIDPFEVRLRPKVYQGELTILSAAAHGATVRSGDVLLQIDPQYLQRDLTAADVALAAAQANLKKAQADVELGQKADDLALKIQNDNLKAAEDSVKWFQNVDGPQILKTAELNQRMLKYSVEDQEDELDQLRKMYKSEELTPATADIVVKRALRRLEMTKDVSVLQDAASGKTKEFYYPIVKERVNDSLEQSRQQLEQLKVAQEQSKVIRDTSLATAQAATDLAQQKVNDLKKDLELLTVKAPADGVVLYGQLVSNAWQRNDPNLLRPTEKVAANQVLMTLYTPGKLQVSLNVPESKLLWVDPGTAAPVTPAALPQTTYAGTAARGNASASELLVSLPQPVDQRLFPGMKANTHIDAGKVDDVIGVPVSAVSAGKVWIHHAADGTDEARDVVLGVSDGNVIEVKQGLAEGDEILQQPPK